VSYRWSSNLAIGLVAVGLVALPSELLPPVWSEGGDDCSLVTRSAPDFVGLAMLLGMIALPVLCIQGLRDRPAPRWLAVAGCLGLGVFAADYMGSLSWCYTTIGSAEFCVCYLGLVAMCLHHTFQPSD